MPGLWMSSRAARVSTASGAGACGPTSSTSGSSPSRSCSNSRAGSAGQPAGGSTVTSPSAACLTRRMRSSSAPASTTRLIGSSFRRCCPGVTTSVPPVCGALGLEGEPEGAVLGAEDDGLGLGGGHGEGDHQALGRGAAVPGPTPSSASAVGVDRRRRALDLGDQHVVQDGVGLRASRPSGLSETTTPTVSPAASRPPTARCGSSRTLTSCRPGGHGDGAGRLQVVGPLRSGRRAAAPPARGRRWRPGRSASARSVDPAAAARPWPARPRCAPCRRARRRRSPRGSSLSTTSTSTVRVPARARASAPCT